MSVWEKLTAVPREVVMTLVVLAMIIPAIRPLGLPILTGGYPSLGPGNIAAFHQMFEKNLKLVIMATALEGTMMYPLIMEEVKPEENYGAVYGEDYVFLGYIAGEQTAMAGVLGDLKSLVSTDYQGTPISQLPLLENINGADDFALVAYLTTAGGVAEGWVYQAYSQYNKPLLGGCLSMMTTSIKPYYDSGQLLGLMDGIKGAADLEFLTGHPGDAIVSSDILSFTQTLVLVFIAIGNISFWMTRKTKEEES